MQSDSTKFPIVTIANLGEQSAEFPMTEEQATIVARLAKIIYNGPGTAEYAALALIAKENN
jgi:hypothetical protein